MTHEQLSESAAGYALGVLDAEEKSAFEAHLPTCAQCRADVESYRETVGSLSRAAPQAAPADHDALRARILDRARDVRPIASARRQPSLGAWIPWTAAAAGIAVAAFSAWLYASERDRNSAVQQQLVAARAEMASRDSALAAFIGPEVHVVSLSEGGNKPPMRVFWNHTSNKFIVTAHNLPPAPLGKTYQLWAIAKDKAPVSMGTFNPTSDRRIAILPVDKNVVDTGFIDFCALTLEPEGGSPQPTEQPRLIGPWRHVD